MNKNINSIDILLATYNGEKYISELLESLSRQTVQHFRVLVHDDGSQDRTVELIRSYETQFSGRMVFLDDGVKFGSAASNFAHLLKYSTASYVAFCDQDDVWLETKIEVLFNAIVKFPTEKPALVFSDLLVVDSSLQVLNNSFWNYEKIDPEKTHLKYLLSRNIVTGCAMMINRCLADLATPIPSEAIMHDWWCACLATCGNIKYISTPLLLYRQHSNNDTGAIDRSVTSIFLKLIKNPFYIFKRIIRLGLSSKQQAISIKNRMMERGLSVNSVIEYINFRELNWFLRAVKGAAWYPTPVTQIVARILLW